MARRRRTSITRVDRVEDVSGRTLAVGDTVSTVSGDLTGRVCGLAADNGTQFVLLRPVHQPYGQGEWHAADRVFWVASARNRDAKGGETPTPVAAARPAAALADPPTPRPAVPPAPRPSRSSQSQRAKPVSRKSPARRPVAKRSPAGRRRRR